MRICIFPPTPSVDRLKRLLCRFGHFNQQGISWHLRTKAVAVTKPLLIFTGEHTCAEKLTAKWKKCSECIQIESLLYYIIVYTIYECIAENECISKLVKVFSFSSINAQFKQAMKADGPCVMRAHDTQTIQRRACLLRCNGALRTTYNTS